MGGDGTPWHAGELAAQLALSFDNVEAVLREAGMSVANLVRLTIHRTDVDLFLQHYGIVAPRLNADGVGPDQHAARGDPAGGPGADGGAGGDRGRVRTPRARTTGTALVTIGVYGFDSESFLRRLREADVRLLCDVRQRRGVRGPEYAWANSRRLRAALAGVGIAYAHHPELAPTTELRHLQYAEDDRRGVGKRSRRELAAEYRRRYTSEILDRADLARIASALPSTGVAALLCVEEDPAAIRTQIGSVTLTV